jgi:hypothetical protein
LFHSVITQYEAANCLAEKNGWWPCRSRKAMRQGPGKGFLLLAQ